MPGKHDLECGELANERGRARQAQAGAEAPVLADEQWAEPAVPASTDQTIDHTTQHMFQHSATSDAQISDTMDSATTNGIVG